jgi:hypothetical protein
MPPLRKGRNCYIFYTSEKDMDGKNKSAAAEAATRGGVKERVFSLIRKLEEEGVTDGRKWMWASFSGTPHVLLKRVEDSYVLLPWREGVYVEVTLDEDFNVIGIDVEVRP